MWHAKGMRIAVCVKHIPDVQSERRIEDGRLVRGEDDVLNELDENAIEAAVSLVEEHGGEVIAVTMGPQDAEDALVRALQMGADRAILVTDERLEGADVVTTARVLGAALDQLREDEPLDMVITGMAALDSLTSALPAALATILHLPYLGLAHQMSLTGEEEGPWTVTIQRTADGFDDTLTSSTPVLVSVTDQINEPRYPSFKTMRAARSKPLDELSLDDVDDASLDEIRQDGAPRAINVLDAQERERDGEGTIVADSGDGGHQLARYLMEEC